MSDRRPPAARPGRPVLTDRPGYRYLPLALVDSLSVCTRCWSVVLRFHQESHDGWHETLPLHTHPANVPEITG